MILRLFKNIIKIVMLNLLISFVKICEKLGFIEKYRFAKLSGKVRTIECDGRKYPTFADVRIAMANGEAVISDWNKNLNPLVGRTAIMRRLRNAGTKTNEGVITYGAVGTDAGTPADSDTTLFTEIARVVVASFSQIDNVLTVNIFFTTTEAVGTLTNFGLFGEDASATLGTGTLFEKCLITKVKDTSKTLTFECVLTLN